MVRLPVGVSAPPGAALSERPQRSNFLGGYLISIENFPDSRQVQSGRFTNLAKRQARLSRTLKGFPPSYPSLIALAVNTRELRLSALHLSTSFVLGVPGHEGSLLPAPTL